MYVCVCTHMQYSQRIWAAWAIMVIGLGPHVSLLAQLWESKRASFHVISADPGSSFLQETTPSFLAGGQLWPLNLASRLNSQQDRTGSVRLLRDSHGGPDQKDIGFKEPAIRLWLGLTLLLWDQILHEVFHRELSSGQITRILSLCMLPITHRYQSNSAAVGTGGRGGRDGLISTEPVLRASPRPSLPCDCVRFSVALGRLSLFPFYR